jgi:apolipoprotein D and lipocalin family protein
MPLSAQEDVVEFVEVDRYMGLWYEIATTPSFQQASCAGTKAEYVFNEAQGWVDVTNICYVGGLSGQPQSIQGRAELVDLETQAKLNVIFFGQAAPYWVVALDGTDSDEPYQWAVVSVPGGQTMWLLSRTPQISEEKRQAIEDHLLERGFPIDTLIDTLQGE